MIETVFTTATMPSGGKVTIYELKGYHFFAVNVEMAAIVKPN